MEVWPWNNKYQLNTCNTLFPHIVLPIRWNKLEQFIYCCLSQSCLAWKQLYNTVDVFHRVGLEQDIDPSFVKSDSLIC